MENKNSKITEEYKAEITGILTKIGQDLGGAVIEKIEPKIIDFTKSLQESCKVVENFNIKQKEIIEKTENYFNKHDDILVNEIKTNRDLIEMVTKESEILINTQFVSLTEKLSFVYKNQLETQFKEIRIKQEKTNIFLYILIFLVLVLFVLVFFIK